MSSQTRCTYEYEHTIKTDPSDVVQFVRPAQTVQCGHPVPADGVDTCLFHGINEEYPRGKATESFLGALSDPAGDSSFAGAYLPGLDLAGETITTPEESPLDLRGAIIDGELDLTDARITVPVILDGATVMDEVIAEGAVFEGPISLADAAFRQGLHWRDASVEGGVVANGVAAQYVDWRNVTVNGPVTFRNASFTSSLQFARGDIGGSFVLSGAAFDWHIDATMLTVDGALDATDLAVDGNVDMIGVTVGKQFTLQGATVDGELNCDHARVNEGLKARGLSVGEDSLFENLRLRTGSVVLDESDVGGKADFGSLSVPNGQFSATQATFDGEVWFTHAEIDGVTDLSRATLNGPGHLRDAQFGDDLLYRRVDDTETSTWMQGSVIKGDIECTGTEFEYFQFSATVHGDAAFTGSAYNDKALFSSSTFEGRVSFDDALFTGYTDFSKAQFTGPVSFDGSEFLVEPTFEEARFATDPALDDATFLSDIDASLEERYRRWELVLVPPESLANTETSLPRDAVTSEFAVPVTLAQLVEPSPKRTKTFVTALQDIEKSAWSDIIDSTLPVARTAVTRLSEHSVGTLVFGINFASTDGAGSLIESVTFAGAYELQEDRFEFTHLSPSLDDIDYLVPVPTSDDAFEVSAAVATRAELRQAMVRHERIRLRQLVTDESVTSEAGVSVHHAAVPLLVAAGRT